MNVVNFAHGGVDHSSQVEAAAHEGSSNVVWILGISIIMAAILYGVIRLLNRRQPEEIKPEEHDR